MNRKHYAFYHPNPSPKDYILIDMLQRSNLLIEVEFNLKSLAPEEPPVIWS